MLHTLPHDVLQIIGSFIIEPIYKLKEEFQEVDWQSLSMNPRAITMLLEHPDKVNPHLLCLNPAAVPYLEKHPEKIDWYYLSENPAAISLIERNLDKVHKRILCANPAAVHLVESHPDWINWNDLCTNPAAIHLIMANPDQWTGRWGALSMNPAFISEIVKESNRDKINWDMLCKNPAAIPLLIEHPEYINPYYLSGNPALLTCGNQELINNTIHLCKTHRFPTGYSRHPEIFELDKKEMQRKIHTWIVTILKN